MNPHPHSQTRPDTARHKWTPPLVHTKPSYAPRRGRLPDALSSSTLLSIFKASLLEVKYLPVVSGTRRDDLKLSCTWAQCRAPPVASPRHTRTNHRRSGPFSAGLRLATRVGLQLNDFLWFQAQEHLNLRRNGEQLNSPSGGVAAAHTPGAVAHISALYRCRRRRMNGPPSS